MTQTLSYAVLKSRALIAISGEDWRGFLQGLITQDVETLSPGEVRFGGLLTPQGRLLFDLFVIGRTDGVWLDVLADTRQALITRLSMYRLRAKVTITPGETEVAAAFGGGPAPEGWMADPRLAALGWRGYGLPAPIDARLVPETSYDTHRLTVGVPGPVDWDAGRVYPIEANFDLLNGIDFKKGCFVGQETTSRMKRRGEVKNRMLPLWYEGVPLPLGAEILSGVRRVGEVTSSEKGRAMAMIRLDRISGDFTVDGRPVEILQPDWITS